MPPRRDTGFTFPPKLTQLIQQQNALMQLLVHNQGNNNNNPPPPPPVDNLARFLRLQPPVFSSSTEPIVADDWLRKIERELTTAGCTDAERVRFAAHQLDGPATSWWENYIIIDDTDSDPDSSDDGYEAKLERISWSLPPIKISSRPPCY